MSPKHTNFRRRALGRPLAVAVFVLALLVTAAVGVAVSGGSSAQSGSVPAIASGERELSPALQQKLGSSQAFSPGEPAQEGGSEDAGDGASDWYMHASPATDISLAAVNASREDWKALKSRGNSSAKLGAHGLWTNLGPDNAVYPLNQYRNRSVYVPNEYVAAGRTAYSVIDPNCVPGSCRYWIANAGGGVWRTDDALAAQPAWEYLSAEFEHNNTAALELDPNDPTSNVLYAGTGEPNICRSGCLAGVGLYKSKDGGDHWSGPIGAQYFSGRGIGSIQVKPGDSSTILVASGAQGSRGLSSTCCAGMDRGATIPDAPHFGLWRSTDGGQTFTLVNQGNATNCTDKTPTEVFLGTTPCSPRGARRVMFDPVDPNTVYASFFAKGIWRSSSNGDPGTWTQIFAPLAAPTNASTGAGVERAEFDVVALPNGATRMYVGVGGGGTLTAKFFRSDSVRTGTPVFTDLTNTTSQAYCDPQCNYDNYVYVPRKADGSAHNPDTVYLIGSNAYGEAASGASNGRAVLLSTDAGVSFTDMTYDDADDVQPHGIHPDQHSITTNPADWKQFIETSDGGVIRSNGNFVDDSGDCTAVRHLTDTRLALCLAVTSWIPERLQSLNKGLNTLHFYQVTFNPNRPGELAGGAQDNGSWMSVPGTKTWIQTFVADGGYAAFDAVDPNYSTLESQSGGIRALDEPRNQEAVFWIADTLLTRDAAAALQYLVRRRRHQRERHLRAADRRLRRLEGDGRRGPPRAAHVRPGGVLSAGGDSDRSVDGRMSGAVPVGRRPLGRPDLGRRAGLVRPQRRLGRDQRGPDLRHDERGRRRSGHDRLASDRHELHGRPGAVPDGHLRRSVGSRPRIHLLQRLQQRDAHHAGPRLRRAVRPHDRHRDVHEPRRCGPVRARRRAGGNDRAGREEGDAVRGHRLRRRQATGPRHRLDAGNARPADDDDPVPEDRPGEPRHVRHDARLRRLDAQAAVTTAARADSRGRLRAAPRASSGSSPPFAAGPVGLGVCLGVPRSALADGWKLQSFALLSRYKIVARTSRRLPAPEPECGSGAGRCLGRRGLRTWKRP